MLLGVPQISRIVSLPDAGSEGVVSRERAERLERTSGETEPYGDGDNGKGGVNGSPHGVEVEGVGRVGIGTKEDGHERTQRGKKSSSTRCTPRQGGLVTLV